METDKENKPKATLRNWTRCSKRIRNSKPRIIGTINYLRAGSRPETIVLLLFAAIMLSSADSFPQGYQQAPCTCDDLRQQILNAPSNPTTETVITIPPGYYYCNQGLEISGKSHLRLRGSGRDKTLLHFAYPAVQNGILIGSNVDDLEISGFSLQGSIPLDAIKDTAGSCPENYHRGIGTVISILDRESCKAISNTYSTNISNIRIFDMDIFAFGTGIQIHPLCNDTQGIPDENGRNIEIRDNFVHELGPFVYGGGWGYGIHSACIKDFVVKANIVLRAARHAIYYGGGNHTIADYQSRTSSSHVFIEDNLIIESGDSSSHNFGISNLTIARTSFVSVANNTIVNPWSIAISVESEDRVGYDPSGWHPQNIVVVGNRIMHSFSTGSARQTWLSIPTVGLPSTERVFLLGNTFNSSPTSLMVHESNSTSMDGVDHSQDFYAATTPTSWVGVQAVAPASTGGLYIMQGNVLHHTDSTWKTLLPGNWTYTYSSTNWSGFQAMDVTCSYLFVLQNGVLHRLRQGDIHNYEVHHYSDGTVYNWAGTQAFYATKQNLYIVQNNSLHRIPEEHWQNVERPGDSPDGNFLTRLMELVVVDESYPCGLSTAVDEIASLNPVSFLLEQNYPNPFNTETIFEYNLPSYGDVKLEIYNTLGEKVRTLLQTHQPAGNYKVQWDGRNETGTKVSTGIYFYELTALGTKRIRKLLLLQ